MSNTGECQTKNQGDYDVRKVDVAVEVIVVFISVSIGVCIH
jgi:hypothetical protein